MQKHIALFLSYLGGGGAERVMLNLARGFVEQGLRVDLVLGDASGPHVRKIPVGVDVIDLKASDVLSSLFALAHYLRQKRPTALFSALHYTNEVAIWSKQLAGVPTQVVVSEHNTLSKAMQNKSGIKRHLIPFYVKYFYPLADKVVTVSQGVAADMALMTGLPSDRIQVIYNPVITPELLERAQQPIDHPWFKPGEPPVVLGVGKLEAQKDFPTLIRAFAQVRQVQPARLMILGWGPDRPQLEALVAELGLEMDIALPGYVDNPFPYMAKAAVFVLSSAWEGLPTVLIEAMAVNTPVVSTNCESGPVEILNDGKYGYLSAVGDSDALAQSIVNVLSGKVKSVDPTWLKQFTLETATHEYLRVLNL